MHGGATYRQENGNPSKRILSHFFIVFLTLLILKIYYILHSKYSIRCPNYRKCIRRYSHFFLVFSENYGAPGRKRERDNRIKVFPFYRWIFIPFNEENSDKVEKIGTAKRKKALASFFTLKKKNKLLSAVISPVQ